MITNLAFLNTTTSGLAVTASPLSVQSNALTNDTPMAGDILASNIAAPATPATGLSRIYVDGAGKVLSSINDAGAICRAVFPSSAPAGQFATGLNASGALTYGAPILGLRNYIDGFVVTNDGTSPLTVLDIGPGMAMDSANVGLISNGTTFNKSISGAWVAGSGAAGMGVALTASTWYFVFVIMNGGFFDAYIDNSATGTNAPAGTTALRCIYAFKTNASSQIIPILQNGDDFLWTTPINEVNYATAPSAFTNLTITVPPQIVVNANIYAVIDTTAVPGALGFTCPTIGTTGIPNTATNGMLLGYNDYASGQLVVRTNTAQQISLRYAGGGTATYLVETLGWNWRRGRQ